jgi:type I restriction enzyme S subunit
MFGDPVSNSGRFPTARLGQIASVERGRFSPRPRNDPSYYGGDYPFIQTGDIAESGGYLTRWRQTLNERGRSVSKEFPPGTIVIAIVGATIGQTAILGRPMHATDSVVGIQPQPDRALAEYIIAVLRHWRPVFIAQAPETARANLNAATLKAVELPLPPLPLQQQFAQRVAEIRELEAAQAASRLRLESLFQSMLHRAFNGAL